MLHDIQILHFRYLPFKEPYQANPCSKSTIEAIDQTTYAKG